MTNAIEIDPFARFRDVTRARIGLGRSGDAMPTRAILEFQLAHARARDAVHGQVDFQTLKEQLLPAPSIHVRSRAKDRATYLSRPDLGRTVNSDDLPTSSERHDIAFVIADGLSAAAVESHAVPLFKACMKRLGGFTVAPVILGEQARVAFGDEAAAAFGAEVAIVLIGERPGLSVPDSLGAYITFRPRAGRRDSERNCISNIHADGLSYEAGAEKVAWIVREALRLQLTGVDLKENAEGATEALSYSPS